MLSGLDAGAGIRVFSGTNSAYAYTCDISPRALIDAAVSAAQTLRAHAREHCKDFVVAPARPIQQVLIRPQAVEAKQRVQVAQSLSGRQSRLPEIVQTQVAVMDV